MTERSPLSRRGLLRRVGVLSGTASLVATARRGRAAEEELSFSIDVPDRVELAPGEAATLNMSISRTGTVDSDGVITSVSAHVGMQTIADHLASEVTISSWTGYEILDQDSGPNAWSRENAYSGTWGWAYELIPKGGTVEFSVEIRVLEGADPGEHAITFPLYTWGSGPLIQTEPVLSSVHETTVAVADDSSFDLSASFRERTVAPGGKATIDVTLTNTGSTASDAVVSFQPAGNGAVNTDYYGNEFGVVEHADDGGDWSYEGWVWPEIGPGESREPSVTVSPADSLAEGTYTFGLSGPGNASATASITVADATRLSVEDVRLLQLAENTRATGRSGVGAVADESDLGSVVPGWSPDPDLVVGKRTVPVFDIETEADPSTVDTGLEVTVSWDPGSDHTFTLSPEYVGKALEESVLSGLVAPLGDVLSSDADSTYPVFSLNDDLSEMTIEVSPLAEGYAGGSATLSNVSPTTMPALNVGFVLLSDTEDRTQFAEVPLREFYDEVDRHLTTLQDLFPTETVNAYVHDNPIALEHRGIGDRIGGLWGVPYLDAHRETAWETVTAQARNGTVTTAEGGPYFGDLIVVENGRLVRSTRPDWGHGDLPEPTALHIDEFDAVVAFCPDSFIDTLYEPSAGLEPHEKSGVAVLVEADANAPLEERETVTTAHELTHHFLGEYETVGYHQEGDRAHAAGDVVSTTFSPPAGGDDVALDTKAAAEHFDVAEPYMAPSSASASTDTLTVQRLIDNGFTPASAESGSGDDGSGWTGPVLSLTATASTDGIEVASVNESAFLPPTTDPDGDATVTLRGATGAELRTVSLSTSTTAGAAAEGENTTTAESDVTFVTGRVPYPDATASVEVNAPAGGDGTDGTRVSTTVNPITRTLRDELAALPDGAFASDPDASRTRLRDLLDDATAAMSDGQYSVALETFRTLRATIRDLVRADYDPTAANRRSRDALLAEVGDRIARVETLAAHASGGFDVAQFDRDDDGTIGFTELRYATRAYNRGEITGEQYQRVVEAYETGEEV